VGRYDRRSRCRLCPRIGYHAADIAANLLANPAAVLRQCFDFLPSSIPHVSSDACPIHMSVNRMPVFQHELMSQSLWLNSLCVTTRRGLWP
jgi:hypothetical protein